MVKTSELVRLTDSRYRQILAAGQLIEKNRGGREDFLFMDRDNYPTAEMLQENGVGERVRKFLPWLIYYRDVYEPDSGNTEECRRSRQCIDSILGEGLDIIPDEAMAPVDRVTPKKWGDMDLERRCGVFRELVSYYSWFMNFYRITDRSGYAECERLTEDLMEVWEKLQTEPVQY